MRVLYDLNLKTPLLMVLLYERAASFDYWMRGTPGSEQVYQKGYK